MPNILWETGSLCGSSTYPQLWEDCGLDSEPKTLCLLHKCSTTNLQPEPACIILMLPWDSSHQHRGHTQGQGSFPVMYVVQVSMCTGAHLREGWRGHLVSSSISLLLSPRLGQDPAILLSLLLSGLGLGAWVGGPNRGHQVLNHGPHDRTASAFSHWE